MGGPRRVVVDGESGVLVPDAMAELLVGALVLVGKELRRNGQRVPPAPLVELLAVCEDAAANPAEFHPRNRQGVDVLAAPHDEGLLQPGQVAGLLGITEQAVTQRCRRFQIPGAQRVGRVWLIPERSVAAMKEQQPT